MKEIKKEPEKVTEIKEPKEIKEEPEKGIEVITKFKDNLKYEKNDGRWCGRQQDLQEVSGTCRSWHHQGKSTWQGQEQPRLLQ